MVRLVPREEKYFGLLNELAAQVKRGGEVFVRVFQDFQNRARYAEEIKNIEVVCDDLGGKITKKLNSSFITPIDREDIYLLVTELDDVIDMINDVARKLDIFDISTPRPEAVGMADLLGRATVEVEAAFALLGRHEGFDAHCSAIKHIEKEADGVYSDALRRLFREEREPIEVIKWMSIFDELENCIDRCKDVAEALEAVVVKNK